MSHQSHFSTLPLISGSSADAIEPYAVRRIICIGRNYEEHAKEMGHAPNEAPPFFFYKPITALLPAGIHGTTYAAGESPFQLPHYSQNIHHELELAIAIGHKPNEDAPEQAILGCGLALDMTCRDTQAESKKGGRPWDTAKGFDYSAPCSDLIAMNWNEIEALGDFTLTHNEQCVQKGNITQMIWPIPQLITEVMRSTQLDYGDIILTGTPAGVGAVNKGDTLKAYCDDERLTLNLNIEK